MPIKPHPIFSPFENLIDPLAEAPVERPPDNLLGFYWHYLKPVKTALVLTVIGSFLSAISDLALFVFVGWLVDWTATDDPGSFFADHGATLLLMAAFVLVARPLIVLFGRGTTGLALSPGLTNLVRWRTHRYVLRQSLSFFQNDFAGRIAQKVTQTSARMRETVVSLVDAVLFLVVFLLGTVGLFAELDWRLAVAVAVWALGYGALVWLLVPSVRKKSARLSEMMSVLTGRIVDSYTNILSVKLFAEAGREDAYVREGIGWHTDAFRALMRATVAMTTVLTLMNSVLIAGIGALSLWLWTEGAISAGAIALSLGLAIRINQMSGWILRSITSLFEDIGTVENGMETIAQPIAVLDRPGAAPLVVRDGEVRFQRVSFAYEGADDVIRDLDLTIRPGEKVGVVGTSGAGKSTLVSLLLRMHDLTDGRILVDGQDISEVTQASLRRAVGVVTQDPSLLHRSVRANIAYGRPEASEEEVVAAARRAEAWGFIATLVDPKGRRGLDAHVGERGVKLSGGQRQRISVARVMLKDAPILVLDEATSALDSEVEAAIQENLARLMEGKTVIAIAHRLSTIAAMDRLVVIDEGRVVEEGAHAALIAEGGIYARLWSRQSGGFLADVKPARGEGLRVAAAAE